MNIKVDWSYLSGNTNIPFTFFEKHISSCEQLGIPDKINWSGLSGNTNIPYQFFEKHISSCKQLGIPDKLNWSMLSRNTNIPVTFFSLSVEKTVRNIFLLVNNVVFRIK